MPINFDLDASNAVFCLPNVTGKFDDEFCAYLRGIGAKRPLVMFAFPPKSAGTFLRAAAVEAIDGQMMRVTHAQGGRDATPYLPIFILYFAGGFPASTMVTHLHMQALPANRFLIEALNLKPVVMLRDVPDMLLSYWEMLEGDQSSDNWVNCQLPANFTSMCDDDKADFLIDILAPWYASYFATWLSYAEESFRPGLHLALPRSLGRFSGDAANRTAARGHRAIPPGVPARRRRHLAGTQFASLQSRRGRPRPYAIQKASHRAIGNDAVSPLRPFQIPRRSSVAVGLRCK